MKPEHILRTDEDRARFIAELRAWPIEKPLAVTVKPWRKKRTTRQNREYWWQINGMVDWLALETGHTADELHMILRHKFCPKKRRTVAGEDIAVQSTTLLDTVEMSNYRERCIAWAAETFGYVAEDPIPANVREEIQA